jgi:magnesium transporter
LVGVAGNQAEQSRRGYGFLAAWMEFAVGVGMFRKRFSKPGSAPATLTPHLLDGVVPVTEVKMIRYDRDCLIEESLDGWAKADEPWNGVTWIDVGGLGNVEVLRALGDRFRLHPLALEDVLNTGQRPKVESTGDYLFVCMQMVFTDKVEGLVAEQVSLFLGKNFVITVQEDGMRDTFDPVRERIRSGLGMIRKSGADYLGYALLDSIIDHYFPVIEELTEEMEELEDRMLETPSREMVLALHGHRRNLTQIRRLVWPMRDVVNALLHDGSAFVTPPTKVFLRDCYDHTVQLMDLVESLRELTSSLMELYHSSVGLRTNEIMRVLTVITSVFIPLTFIVGVYGMNFASESADGAKMPWNMPELYHPLGYVGVLLLMLVIAVAQVLFFRRMKWL